MKSFTYSYVPFLQQTNATCVQASASMLVSHLDESFDAERMYQEAPGFINENGIELGSSLVTAAAWCAKQKIKTKVWSFDAMLLDMNWEKLPQDAILERLNAVRDTREARVLGKELTGRYIDDYIHFIEYGGHLSILPFVSQQLLNEIISKGPFCAGVSYPTLKGNGHAKNTGLRESIADDTSNGIATHAVLVYGRTETGEYMIADPWGAPIEYTVSEDQLLSAIMAAQWFCDNVIFTIE